MTGIKEKKKRHTIRSRVLRNQLFLSVLPLCLLFTLTISVQQLSVIQGADRSLEEMSRYLESQLRNNFNGLEDSLAYWMTNQELRSYITFSNQTGSPSPLPEGLGRELEKFAEDYSIFTMELFDKQGMILEPGALPFTRSGIAGKGDEKGTPAESPWRLQSGDETEVVERICALSNFTETETIGYLRISADPHELSRYLEEHLAADSPFLLLDGEGRILASNIGDALLRRMILRRNLSPGKIGSLELKGASYRGRQILMEDLKLSFVSLYDYSDHSRTSRLFVLFMLPLILLIILASALAAMNMSAKIVSPLSALIHSIQTTGRGNLRGMVEVSSELEEIRVLTESHNRMIARIQSLIEENQKTNLLRVESQLNALQQKIDPHFLFNTLELISSQALFEQAPSTRKMIQILGRLFRYNLRAPDLLELNREIAYAEDYLFLQRYRFDGNLEYSIEFEDGLEGVRVPKLTLQPILENAVKHGFRELGDGDNRIVIRVYSAGSGGVEIQLSDSGSGMSPETAGRIEESLKKDVDNFGYFISRREHIGLRNVNARLCLLYKTDQAVFLGQEGPLSHTITIRIPGSTGAGSIKL